MMSRTHHRQAIVILFSLALLSVCAGPTTSTAVTDSGTGPGDDLGRLPADVAARYGALKPRAEELRWQQVPWLVDLIEGIRQARAEHRPLLIWVSGDDPLERC